MENLEKLQELAVALPKGAADQAKSLMQKMGQKISGIGDKDIEWRPDNLKIVQAVSDRSKLPKNANIGALVLGEKVLDQPIAVIPLRIWDTRQYWSPDQTEAKLLCSSPDNVLGYIGKYCKECEFSKFDVEANRSACNKSKTALVITEDLSTVFLINFSKTNYSNGVDFANLMKKAGVAPFRRVYTLATETSKKFKNVEALLVGTKGYTDEKHLSFLEALFSRFSDDRKEHLKVFHEMILNKRQDQLALAGPDDSVPDSNLIEAPVDNKPTGKQVEMSKKYSM